ncbi:hypothetical protein ASPZODRAFT_696718 [Penicilliopsis zonata CBS 506.65]|uniref:Uncharacterized protein n=1 Tax=Penicilliopsis zonata CBS 506.65 TaxID=1073090 RepID=A0A1L9SBT4_9EURO|nr:hypothetical protein ASPZODRAFT_696718 [Penicilliopsis zonata CBS 506.65]OJJ44588.1 hypothetical protein ASPZODRAFT_696718 [Penicilliopsis zonata CBS 506.65]
MEWLLDTMDKLFGSLRRKRPLSTDLHSRWGDLSITSPSDGSWSHWNQETEVIADAAEATSSEPRSATQSASILDGQRKSISSLPSRHYNPSLRSQLKETRPDRRTSNFAFNNSNPADDSRCSNPRTECLHEKRAAMDSYCKNRLQGEEPVSVWSTDEDSGSEVESLRESSFSIQSPRPYRVAGEPEFALLSLTSQMRLSQQSSSTENTMASLGSSPSRASSQHTSFTAPSVLSGHSFLHENIPPCINNSPRPEIDKGDHFQHHGFDQELSS